MAKVVLAVDETVAKMGGSYRPWAYTMAAALPLATLALYAHPKHFQVTLGAGIAAGLCLFIGMAGSTLVSERRNKFEAGKKGERAVARRLEGLPDEYLVLHNLRLLPPGNKFPLEIDHLVLSAGKAWVIETKSFSGSVDGSPEAESWDRIKVSGGGNVYESKVRNPIKQNRATIGRLRRVLDDLAAKKAIPPLRGYWFENMVAMDDGTGLRGALQHCKDLTPWEQVVDKIVADTKGSVLSPKQLQELAATLAAAHVPV